MLHARHSLVCAFAIVRALALAAGLALVHGRTCAQTVPEAATVMPPATSVDVEPPGAPGDTPPASGEWEGLFRGLRMELGPVRWSGNLGQQYQWQTSSEPARSRSRTDLLNLKASSYIGQPWFAQVRAGAGVLHSTTHATAGAAPATTSASSDSTSTTGDLGLFLFPVSRFPLDAYMNVSDTRAGTDLTTTDFRHRKVGVRQSYRTVDDSTRYTARYEQSELTSATFGRDTLDVFDAAVTKRREEHTFELNGAASSSRGGADQTDSEVRKMSGRHAYHPGSNLSAESLATYNQNTLTSATNPSLAAVSRVRQVTSFGTWRPDEGDSLYEDGRPLVVTASGRLFSVESEASGTAVDTETANATAGASYAVNAHTRVGGSMSATQVSTGGATTRVTTQNFNATYAPNPLKLGETSYAWNLSGGAGNAAATRQSPRQTSVLQAAHSVSRGYETGPGARVSLIGGQSAGWVHDQSGNVPSLTHNAGANWSAGGATGAMTYVSLNASDSRAFAPVHRTFQLVNFQATRQAPLTLVSYWSGNFTVQGTRQQSEQANAGFAWTTTGSVTYQNQHALGVPRLTFIAIYSANSQRLSSRTQGDLDAPREFTSQSAEARFEYRIGKLELRLSARTAHVEDRRVSMLFFRVLRHL